MSDLNNCQEFCNQFVLSVLGNLSPAQIFYKEVDGEIKLEFKEQKTTLNDCRLSELMWMAPEILKMNLQPVSHCQTKIFPRLLIFPTNRNSNIR